MADWDARDYTPNRRACKQIKRLFILAGIVEAEGTCTVNEAFDLFLQRANENISSRQIRRDLALLSELGVLQEWYREIGGQVLLRYTFIGWPIAVH